MIKVRITSKRRSRSTVAAALAAAAIAAGVGATDASVALARITQPTVTARAARVRGPVAPAVKTHGPAVANKVPKD